MLATHANRELMCWPPITLLSRESRLAERSIITHLQNAVRDGWITRKRKGQGKGWKNYNYTLIVPSPPTVAPAIGSGANAPHAPAGRSPASSKTPKPEVAAAPLADGPATDDKMLLKDVHPNRSVNSSNNKSINMKAAKPLKSFGSENSLTPIEEWALDAGITRAVNETPEDYRRRVTQEWARSHEGKA